VSAGVLAGRVLCAVCLAGSVRPASAAAPALDDAQVDSVVEALIAELKGRQITEDIIRVDGPIQPEGAARAEVHATYTGLVVEQARDHITFQTADGQRFKVKRLDFEWVQRAGLFKGEHQDYTSGGRTALATLALLSAGLSGYDRNVQLSLQALRDHPMPGTYGRALRASVYALLVERSADEEARAYRELLEADLRWLMAARLENGGYDYLSMAEQPERTRQQGRFDNSNTQFGVLGVWTAALAGANVPRSYWLTVEHYWCEQQSEEGGWGYMPGKQPSENMTIAGLNSLIIVLDQVYARAAGKYVLFEGLPQQQRNWEEIHLIQQRQVRGLDWLSRHRTNKGEPYTYMGIERLGLASGEKYFGGRDWYREGAALAANQSSWRGAKIEHPAMWLLFLGHGRAPVLFNKLKWGGDVSGWDEYFRDLHHVCRFLSRTYEQLYKWQVISTDASLRDIQDAPFLVISGESVLELPAELAARIQTHVRRGGTVIGHANRGSAAFAESFKSVFERLLASGPRRFRQLPPDHVLYRAGPGGESQASKVHVPLWGLSDGSREMALLFDRDVAGAWHQDLHKEFPDLFWIMANVRFYGAPSYDELPARLRPDLPPASAQSLHRVVRVSRPRIPADPGGAEASWEVLAERVAQSAQLRVDIVEGTVLEQLTADADFDLLHVVGQGGYKFSPGELAALKRHWEQGGVLLCEAFGGDAQFALSCRMQLEAALGVHFAPLPETSSLLAGTGGLPHFNRWARGCGPDSLQLAVSADDRSQAIVASLDLSVPACGQHVHGLRGFTTPFSQKLLENLLIEAAMGK
jgi:hypothetical protein